MGSLRFYEIRTERGAARQSGKRTPLEQLIFFDAEHRVISPWRYFPRTGLPETLSWQQAREPGGGPAWQP